MMHRMNDSTKAVHASLRLGQTNPLETSGALSALGASVFPQSPVGLRGSDGRTSWVIPAAARPREVLPPTGGSVDCQDFPSRGTPACVYTSRASGATCQASLGFMFTR